jgi:hypothetical protein
MAKSVAFSAISLHKVKIQARDVATLSVSVYRVIPVELEKIPTPFMKFRVKVLQFKKNKTPHFSTSLSDKEHSKRTNDKERTQQPLTFSFFLK